MNLETTTNYGLMVTREDKLNYYKAMEKQTVQEKPILFSTELVQAILDGRKTQTRRVIKPQSDNYTGDALGQPVIYPVDGNTTHGDRPIRCPYGQPGDELWVRETWRTIDFHDDRSPSEIISYLDGNTPPVQYKSFCKIENTNWGRTRPSIHMPRELSRIQLTVQDIRVERVQEITPRDAWAEGVKCGCMKPTPMCKGNIDTFADLWDSINADRGYPWESNPWVWVVEFEVKEVKG